MPTFKQARFIGRALESLRTQTFAEWELLMVVDGPPDKTFEVVEPYLAATGEHADARIRPPLLGDNEGLGAALNRGLQHAVAPLVAYLPSDDTFDPDHLASLTALLARDPAPVLACSGIRHHGGQEATEQIPGYPLQLVQVVHRRTDDRWMERDELTTDDLERMFWSKLRQRGRVVATGRVSCTWVDHPGQRHRLIREDLGSDANPYRTSGLNPYRARYRVAQPLRFHSTAGNRLDEVGLYQRFRDRPDTPPAVNGLKILLVGELAFNPERVLALEERGHRLYGLWMPNPGAFNTVGPLPFGHVQDLPRYGWREAVRRLQPDVIYALLNWRAVPFAHQVLTNNPGVPFVWHFKEGPWHCRHQGTWQQLVALHTRSDGQIYTSPEMREWFAAEVPGSAGHERTLVLDGDLPKREWLDVARSPRLSATDGQIHTVLAGRPIGLHPPLVALDALARHGIHLHVYGELKGPWVPWLTEARHRAGAYIHEHESVAQDQWVAEFSRYDAGWLHIFESQNAGHVAAATWDDLNYPARIATYVAAGLPLIQRDNHGSVVAMQTLARQRDIGIFFSNVADLADRLRDHLAMARLWDNVWQQREAFTFDSHADQLLEFFCHVIRCRAL